MAKYVATLLFIACTSSLLEAQVTPDLDPGFRPYAPLSGSQLDSVDLLTGNLILNIPLYSLPQRGSVKLSFSLRYSGKNTWTAKTQVANPGNPPLPFYPVVWTWQGSGVIPVRDQLIRHFTDLFASGTQSNTYINFDRVQTSDGEMHQIGPFANGTTSNFGQYLLGSQPGMTIDATGIRLLANGTVVTPDGLNYVIPEYVNNAAASLFNGKFLSGTGLFSDTEQGSISDASGNAISTTGTGWEDSLGRLIPGSPTQSGEPVQTGSPAGPNYGWFSEYLFPGVVTTDFSRCPAGTSHARLWDVPGTGGNADTFVFCFSSITVQSNFQLKNYIDKSDTVTLLSAVSLPNRTSYDFAYNSWGELSTLILPTGGTITYQWATGNPCLDNPYNLSAVANTAPGTGRFLTSRTLNANDGTGPKTWTYSYPVRAGATNSNQSIAQTIVTDPDLNDVEHDFSLPPTVTGLSCSLNETTVKEYAGSQKAGNLLRTTTTQYAGIPNPFAQYGQTTTDQDSITTYDSEAETLANNVPTQVTTTWPNGQQAQKTITYDSGQTFDYTYIIQCCTSATLPLTLGRVTSESMTNYGSGSPGPVIATTQTSYLWQSSKGSGYLTANFLKLPCLISTFGPGTIPSSSGCTPTVQSNLVSQTAYGYDENNGSPQGVYGNQTSQTHWLNNGTSPKSQTVYNSQGMPLKQCQPTDLTCSNPMAYTYDSTGAFPKQIQYPTTNGVQHVDVVAYDANIGKLTSRTDGNGATTTYHYDEMRRLSSVDYPDSGSESYTYNDSAAPMPSVTHIRAMNSSQSMTEEDVYDGFGRVASSTLNDPSGNVVTKTTYDDLGRVQSVSNPYRNTNDATYGITSYSYDALGRKTYQCQPDNASTPSTRCVAGTSYQKWVYNGNTVAFTDEVGNQWQRATDALGRLTMVLEPDQYSNALAYETDYAYDALDNLTEVDQYGGTKGSSSYPERKRTFTYDSLSRLICASNPENSTSSCPATSGVVQYSYDGNSNVIGRTDARGVVTAYGFDSLNRLTSKTYPTVPSSVAPTSSVNYLYDVAVGGWGSPVQTNPSYPLGSSSQTNLLGRLSSTSVGSTGANAWIIYGYDPVGRTILKSECLPIDCGNNHHDLHYRYDLAGNLTFYDRGLDADRNSGDGDNQGFYFGGFTQAFNEAGRITGVTGDTGGTNTATDILANTNYYPTGQLNTSLQLGLYNLTQVADNRGRYKSLNATNVAGQFIWSGSTTWNPDSTAKATTDRYAGSWTYEYDHLGRVYKAFGPNGSTQYTIDPFGTKFRQTTLGGSAPSPAFGIANSNALTGNGLTYDLAGNAGNVLYDGFHNYTYDAEGRLYSVDGTTCYTYDGVGDRVATTNCHVVNGGSGNTTGILREFLYDPNHRLMSEINVSTEKMARGNIYSGDDFIAEDSPDPFLTNSSTATQIRFTDQVGSLRSLWDLGSNWSGAWSSFPYGDGASTGDGGDSGDLPGGMLFAGKRQDAESSLSYFGARYYSSSMGRFLSPDWSARVEPVPYAKLWNPQTLNLYSYVGNNPLSRVDADGHYELNASGCGDNSKCQKRYDKAANQFEKQRQKDLNSKKDAVRNAAANYGARGEANGVHVGFANLNTGANPTYGSVDPSGSTPGNPNIQVMLDFGRAGSAETQTHEGTHVGDDQRFLDSYDPATGGYNQALNPTHGQTEFNAFKAGAAVDSSHGFGPNDDQKIMDFLHNSPTYGPIFNIPVFNPANFPAGVPDDEQ